MSQSELHQWWGWPVLSNEDRTYCTYCVLDTVLSTCCVPSTSNRLLYMNTGSALARTLPGQCYQHFHFTDGRTKMRGGLELVDEKVGMQPSPLAPACALHAESWAASPRGCVQPHPILILEAYGAHILLTMGH